jgi:hypothetical protein
MSVRARGRQHEEGCGPHPCLDPQGEPTPATVTLGGGDSPTVTQAAPSVGSDWVTVLQKGGDGKRSRNWRRRSPHPAHTAHPVSRRLPVPLPVLRPRVPRPVEIIVAEVPEFVASDRLAATGTLEHSRGNQRLEALPQRLMPSPVTPESRGRTPRAHRMLLDISESGPCCQERRNPRVGGVLLTAAGSGPPPIQKTRWSRLRPLGVRRWNGRQQAAAVRVHGTLRHRVS